MKDACQVILTSGGAEGRGIACFKKQKYAECSEVRPLSLQKRR